MRSGVSRRRPSISRADAVTGIRGFGRLIARSIAFATASGPAPNFDRSPSS